MTLFADLFDVTVEEIQAQSSLPEIGQGIPTAFEGLAIGAQEFPGVVGVPKEVVQLVGDVAKIKDDK